MELSTGIILLLIGFISGGYGTIVGAGGGFIFVPVMLMLLDVSPKIAAGTGLVVVLLNSLTSIYGFIKRKRVNYTIGLFLCIGAIPGTILGTFFSNIVSTRTFYPLFSLLLILLGLFLFLKKAPNEDEYKNYSTQFNIEEESAKEYKILGYKIPLIISFIATGFLLGIVSSFFGIGGGWLLVPILIYAYKISPYIATATSIFSLCIYTFLGMTIHWVEGNIYWVAALWGGVGVFFGAHLGVILSNKISSKKIVQLLAAMLFFLGFRMLINN